MIALVCPTCGAFVIAADRPAGSQVHCQCCPSEIAVPVDAPKDGDLARLMKKASDIFALKKGRAATPPDTVRASQTDTSRRPTS